MFVAAQQKVSIALGGASTHAWQAAKLFNSASKRLRKKLRHKVALQPEVAQATHKRFHFFSSNFLCFCKAVTYGNLKPVFKLFNIFNINFCWINFYTYNLQFTVKLKHYCFVSGFYFDN